MSHKWWLIEGTRNNTWKHEFNFFLFFFHFFTKMQFSQGLLGVKISQIELQRKKKVKNLGNTIFRVVYVFDKPVFWPFLFAPKFLRRSFCFGFSVQHEAILFFCNPRKDPSFWGFQYGPKWPKSATFANENSCFLAN